SRHRAAAENHRGGSHRRLKQRPVARRRRMIRPFRHERVQPETRASSDPIWQPGKCPAPGLVPASGLLRDLARRQLHRRDPIRPGDCGRLAVVRFQGHVHPVIVRRYVATHSDKSTSNSTFAICRKFFPPCRTGSNLTSYPPVKKAPSPQLPRFASSTCVTASTYNRSCSSTPSRRSCETRISATVRTLPEKFRNFSVSRFRTRSAYTYTTGYFTALARS